MRIWTWLALSLGLAALAAAQNGRTIQVDVSYTGAGTVDAKHKVYVALWDSAEMGQTPPVEMKSIDKKTGTVTFENVQVSPAYVSTLYDVVGDWDAMSMPPSGTVVGLYTTEPPAPAPIKAEPGKTAKIKLEFDDSIKLP